MFLPACKSASVAVGKLVLIFVNCSLVGSGILTEPQAISAKQKAATCSFFILRKRKGWFWFRIQSFNIVVFLMYTSI
jgi:hypothetical protein